MRDSISKAVEYLAGQKYVKGRHYHMVKHDCHESIMITNLDRIEGLEGNPKVKMYVYIDENFVYKTRTLPPSNEPPINLEIDM
jgi:hypothetical protein